MTEPTDYFARAGDWAYDRERGLVRSRRLAWIVTAMLAGVAGLEALALVTLMPLKKTETVAMLVDRTTGYTQVIDPAAARKVAPDRALVNGLLAQYVTGREGYDRATAQDTYRRIALWSAGPARASYLRAMDYANPTGALASMRPGEVVSVRVRSVSLLSPRTALVRFVRSVQGSGGAARDERQWVAVIGFRFSDGAMSVEDRFTNPLGFQVTSYRLDAETPDLPSQGDVM